MPIIKVTVVHEHRCYGFEGNGSRRSDLMKSAR